MELRSKDKEELIVEMFRQGDKLAMRTLYDEFSSYLTAVCMRYISDADLRKDILQESFIKIFTKIDTFTYRGKGSLKAWMARIVANEALQHIRKSHADLYEDGDIGSMQIELADGELQDDVSDIPQQVLLEMIGGLPPGYRTVFNLFVFEDMSHKEIAEKLNIKADSSASQYHRAKAMLASQISRYRKNQNTTNGRNHG